ncbi:MAG: hypothetical protein ACLR8Y_01385 [Alistipes indistinctus]
MRTDPRCGLRRLLRTAGDMDFINSIARARGTEQVLIDLITDNERSTSILCEARFRFYYEMHERVLQAAGGLVRFHPYRRGPRHPDRADHRFRHFRQALRAEAEGLFLDGARLRRPHDDAHVRLRARVPAAADRIGARRVRCGAADRSADGYRSAAKGFRRQDQFLRQRLRPEYARVRHGGRCGGEVERRKRLFPEGGLFLGPSHAIQVGTPLENILAMYRTAGSLTEEVDDSIPAISEGRDATTINMSKLF